MNRSLNAKLHWCWGPLAACLIAAGCAVPEYKRPGGFSSTYHRHLMAARPLMLSESLPDGSEGPGPGRPRQVGVFYPPQLATPAPREINPVVVETPESNRGRRTAADRF